MLVIPAVDIRGGKCVRLTQGRFQEETVYYADPVEAALRWQDEGAEYLHVVDLDGALSGEPKNIRVLEHILGAVEIPLQFGGGVRTRETVSKLLQMGVDRIVLGTKVVDSPEFLVELCSEYKGHVAVSIDQKRGKVAVKGWTELSTTPLLDIAREVEKAGPRALIFTDISRDGTLQGPNTKLLRKLLNTVKTPVIVSGGIGSLEHLRELDPLPIEGVVIGKALYTGAVSLSQAIELCNPLRPTPPGP